LRCPIPVKPITHAHPAQDKKQDDSAIAKWSSGNAEDGRAYLQVVVGNNHDFWNGESTRFHGKMVEE